MERLTTLQSVSVGTLSSSTWSVPWTRLVPLWRHAVFLIALFVVLAAAVVIRLDVQRLEMALDRNDRAQRGAEVLNERLLLELSARRRLQATEGLAAGLGAGPGIEVEHVRAGERGDR